MPEAAQPRPIGHDVLAAVHSPGEEHPPAPEVSRKGASNEPAPGLEPGTARLQGDAHCLIWPPPATGFTPPASPGAVFVAEIGDVTRFPPDPLSWPRGPG